MSRIALSFSYDGYHRKSSGPIEPLQHLKMLLAAIEAANPTGEHSVIVASLGFDASAISDVDERMLAWEVHKKSAVVAVRNHPEDHQHGAAWAIRMATEAAAAIEADFLIHLAEDVLLAPDAVEYFVRELADCDYVGTWWGNTEFQSLNTQVFACRVRTFADVVLRRFVVDPSNCWPHVEGMLWRRMSELGLKFKVGKPYIFPGREIADVYFHSHDPTEFRSECQRRGIAWPAQRGCRLAAISDLYAHACQTESDIFQHLPTLFSLACQVRRVTEFGTGYGRSTVALLAARPEILACYEINVLDEAQQLQALSDGRMRIYTQNVLKADIEETDLLFIDTHHTYRQLSTELRLHANKSTRWIVLHDTTVFGDRGSDGGDGIWKAVEEFLATHPEWYLKSRVHFNNGLTILERVSSIAPITQ